MKIGFDVSQTGKSKAGCGYVAYSLISALAEIDQENDYLLYPSFGDFYWDPDWSRATIQMDRANVRRGLGHDTYEGVKRFWQAPPTDYEDQLGSPDVVHANNFFCPIGLKKARLMYTLHDLGFAEQPEWTTETNRIGCFDGVFRASIHADRIVAVSEYSRRHFLKIFPHYPAERITVVHLASRFTDAKPVEKPVSLDGLLPDRFWLNVGTLEPRKNQARLIAAYAYLKAILGETFPLVLAGGKGWLMEDFDRVIQEYGIGQDIIKLDYVDDQVLQWLYQNCFAFVYPSLFEGFGMPVLEAMSLGAAVITSNTTSLPEVIGDAGIQVDPLQEESIEQAMLGLVKGEFDRRLLKSQAVDRSKQFSWERSAKRVLEAYQQVISEPSIREIFTPTHLSKLIH